MKWGKEKNFPEIYSLCGFRSEKSVFQSVALGIICDLMVSLVTQLNKDPCLELMFLHCGECMILVVQCVATDTINDFTMNLE